MEGNLPRSREKKDFRRKGGGIAKKLKQGKKVRKRDVYEEDLREKKRFVLLPNTIKKKKNFAERKNALPRQLGKKGKGRRARRKKARTCPVIKKQAVMNKEGRDSEIREKGVLEI